MKNKLASFNKESKSVGRKISVMKTSWCQNVNFSHRKKIAKYAFVVHTFKRVYLKGQTNFICRMIGMKMAAKGFGADQVKTLVDSNQNILIDLYYGETDVSTKSPSF